MAINEFFKNIGKNVKKATNKLDDAVEVQKVKYRISKKEEEIDAVCTELGKAVLEANAQGTDCSEAVAKAIESYSALKGELNALNDERRKLEGKYLCQNCGFEVDDADFCPKCGAKIEKEAEEAEEAETDEKTDEASETEEDTEKEEAPSEN